MRQHKGEWTIEEMADLLGISRSGYYRSCKKVPSPREQANAGLLDEIKQIHKESRGTYGSPRIHAELKARGHRCSRPRVARLMRCHGVVAKMQKLFKRTTRVDKSAAVAANLYQQDFTAACPNRKWVADMSYIRTQEGWLYIAVILDLFSRKIVGLTMGKTLESQLVIKALEQAYGRYEPGVGLQHHSDRGCQYTSQAFQALLKKRGITCSMSGTGNCFDNAAMESFFHTLKTECVYFERYETRAQAQASIFEYVEVFYNNERRHSTLGYLSPREFERRYYQQQLCS